MFRIYNLSNVSSLILLQITNQRSYLSKTGRQLNNRSLQFTTCQMLDRKYYYLANYHARFQKAFTIPTLISKNSRILRASLIGKVTKCHL